MISIWFVILEIIFRLWVIKMIEDFSLVFIFVISFRIVFCIVILRVVVGLLVISMFGL